MGQSEWLEIENRLADDERSFVVPLAKAVIGLFELLTPFWWVSGRASWLFVDV
jgi:hypothetical protein